MSAPPVGIVIVNWNLADDTLACLDSVFQLDYPGFQVVVVDNGSTDGSPARIGAAFPQAAQIVNAENRGFAAGANQGLDWALARGCAYILVLNNDTTVAPDLLARLVAAGESDPQIGILSPRILYFDEPDRTWHLAARWHRWLPMPVHVWEGATFPLTPTLSPRGEGACPPPLGEGLGEGEVFEEELPAGVIEADFVSGCAMMLRRSLLEAVGGFDAGYFMYGEDIDLCTRAKQAGYRIVAVPGARMWHKVSVSAAKASTEMCYWRTRNQIRVYRRYLDGWRGRLLPGYVLLKALVDVGRDLARGQADLVGPLLRGVRDGLRGSQP